MPIDDAAKRGAEGVEIERAVDAQGGRHEVRRALWIELVQEPEPLLREREDRRFADRPRLDLALARRRAGDPADARGKRGDRRRLEDVLERNVFAEGLPHARDQPRRDERVTAELEEVVVAADAVAAEHVGPERGEQLLGEAARRLVGLRRRVGERARRERPAIDLAVRRERQPLDRDDDRRHEMLGQPLTDERLQVRVDGPVEHDEGRELRVARRGLSRDHGGFAHRRVRRERGFHLAGLDPVAAHLHLVVGAAEEFEDAVGAPARDVAAAVHPRSRLGRERIGEEAFAR